MLDKSTQLVTLAGKDKNSFFPLELLLLCVLFYACGKLTLASFKGTIFKKNINIKMYVDLQNFNNIKICHLVCEFSTLTDKPRVGCNAPLK